MCVFFSAFSYGVVGLGLMWGHEIAAKVEEKVLVVVQSLLSQHCTRTVAMEPSCLGEIVEPSHSFYHHLLL